MKNIGEVHYMKLKKGQKVRLKGHPFRSIKDYGYIKYKEGNINYGSGVWCVDCFYKGSGRTVELSFLEKEIDDMKKDMIKEIMK